MTTVKGTASSQQDQAVNGDGSAMSINLAAPSGAPITKADCGLGEYINVVPSEPSPTFIELPSVEEIVTASSTRDGIPVIVQDQEGDCPVQINLVDSPCHFRIKAIASSELMSVMDMLPRELHKLHQHLSQEFDRLLALAPPLL